MTKFPFRRFTSSAAITTLFQTLRIFGVCLILVILYFMLGCSTSGRVVNSQEFFDKEAAYHKILREEEKNCIETGGEYTEYGCYFEYKCFLLDKTPVPCEDIEPYPVKYKVQCIDIGGVWVDGKGCNLDD